MLRANSPFPSNTVNGIAWQQQVMQRFAVISLFETIDQWTALQRDRLPGDEQADCHIPGEPASAR